MMKRAVCLIKKVVCRINLYVDVYVYNFAIVKRKIDPQIRNL